MRDLFSALIGDALCVVLAIGFALGLGGAGIVWLIWYLCHHITIGWKP